MSSIGSRISRIERSASTVLPSLDWTETRAYLALSDVDRETLDDFTRRFSTEGLSSFTDEELEQFEILLMPIATEERALDQQV